MEENKLEEKKKSGGLVISFIIIMIILLLGLAEYICYDKFYKKDNLKCKSRENNKIEQIVTEKVYEGNNYDIFAQNMIKNRKKFNSYSGFYDCSVDGTGEISYCVELKANGDLIINYMDEKYSKVYSNYKLAENVLSFYIIDVGQGQGHYLYFINKDGTVGEADTEYALQFDKELSINKDLGYKNIVSIEAACFSSGGSGANDPVFIDIDGNIFSRGFED